MLCLPEGRPPQNPHVPPQILVRRPYLRAHEASPALVEELLDGRR